MNINYAACHGFVEICIMCCNSFLLQKSIQLIRYCRAYKLFMINVCKKINNLHLVQKVQRWEKSIAVSPHPREACYIINDETVAEVNSLMHYM